MTNKNVIDYLPEDRKIKGQKYCIVSVVGPNLKQKCDLYAIKVRGVADSEREAKQMCERIMKYDNKFDTYVTEVGRFFPLDISAEQVKSVEFLDTRLNALVKNYTENRIEADNQFSSRKQEMMDLAISEGKNQEILSSKPEHPIAVYSRMNDTSSHIKELQDQIKGLEQDHTLAEEKWNSTYSETERKEALEVLENKINEQKAELSEEHGEDVKVNKHELVLKATKEIEQTFEQETEKSFDDIQRELSGKLVQSLLSELPKLDEKINELSDTISIPGLSDVVIDILQEQKKVLLVKKSDLMSKLESLNTRDYINSMYPDSNNEQFLNDLGDLRVKPSS